MPGKDQRKEKNYVYPVRDWKEYLGESALIIFSVLLALIFTEYFNGLHEKENTKGIIKNIVAELKLNKQSMLEMKVYNDSVMHKISTALDDKNMQAQLVANDEFHLKMLAHYGVQYRFLENNAWTIAKNNNIMSKMDAESVLLLTKVYDDQDRIGKIEDEVAKILLDRASRDPKQVHATLMLLRDVYNGWVVERTPHYLHEIDDALKKIEEK